MTRGVGGRSPANLQKFLRGAEYPCKKRDLIETAMENGAPREVMDTLWDLEDDEFGGPQDVQKAYGEEDEDEGHEEQRGRTGHSPEDLIYHYLDYKGQADSYTLDRMLDREGIRAGATQFITKMVREGDLVKNRDGSFSISRESDRERDQQAWPQREESRGQEREPSRQRGQEREREQSRQRHEESRRRDESRGQSQQRTRNGNGNRRSQDDDDDVESHRREKPPEIERRIEQAEQRYEEGQSRQGHPARETDDADWQEWDHRLRGHQTKAIDDARQMRHGYDGRGVVEHPDRDKRLRGQETQAIDDARHMRRGYDGRGRVTKLGPGRRDEDNSEFPGAAVNVHHNR